MRASRHPPRPAQCGYFERTLFERMKEPLSRRRPRGSTEILPWPIAGLTETPEDIERRAFGNPPNLHSGNAAWPSEISQARSTELLRSSEGCCCIPEWRLADCPETSKARWPSKTRLPL